MKTELQFLLDLLLNHKLPKGTKKLITDRIGEVENQIIPQPRNMLGHQPVSPQIVSSRMPPPEFQAPTINMAPVPGAVMPPADIDKQTGRPVVATGNGTRGPRKF